MGVIIGPVWPEETGKDEIGTVVPEWIVIRPEGEGEDVTKGEGPEHGSGPEEPMVYGGTHVLRTRLPQN